MSLFEQTNIPAAEIALVDGGRSSCTAAVARGTARLLHALGFCSIAELPLASGRRADLVGLGAGGEVVIVEIKRISGPTANGTSIASIATDCSSQRRSAFGRTFFPATPA